MRSKKWPKYKKGYDSKTPEEAEVQLINSSLSDFVRLLRKLKI